MKTLESCLERLTLDGLKERGRLLPFKVKLPGRKAALLKTLAQAIREQLEGIVVSLDDVQRLAVSHMVFDGWEVFDPRRFRVLHETLPDWGDRTWWGTWERQTALWLLFYDDAIPAELHGALRSLLEPVPAPELAIIDGPMPETIAFDFYNEDGVVEEFEQRLWVHQAEPLALQEVQAMLAAVSRAPIRLTKKTQQPTKASVRKLTQALCGADFMSSPQEWGDIALRGLTEAETQLQPVRALGWFHLFVAAGVLEVRADSARFTDVGRQLLGKPAHEVIKTLWRSWIDKSNRFETLTRVPMLGGLGGRGMKALRVPHLRRQALSWVLEQCPAQKWVFAAATFRHIIAVGKMPGVVKARADLSSLYIGDPRYGCLEESANAADILFHLHGQCFFMEYASTLGLVDVVYMPPDMSPLLAFIQRAFEHVDSFQHGAHDGLWAIRLTPLGAWVLGKSAQYAPGVQEVAASLRVLPNADVVMLNQGGAGVIGRALLDLFADNQGGSTWPLRRARLLKAIAEGHDLKSLRDFLEANALEPLPPGVVDLFERVQRRASMVSYQGTAVVFDVREPMVALELANHPKLRALCKLAGGNQLVVLQSDEKKFRRALQALDYTALGPQ